MRSVDPELLGLGGESVHRVEASGLVDLSVQQHIRELETTTSTDLARRDLSSADQPDEVVLEPASVPFRPVRTTPSQRVRTDPLEAPLQIDPDRDADEAASGFGDRL